MTAEDPVHRRLEQIELRLRGLSDALRGTDAAALDEAAIALRKALGQAIGDLRPAVTDSGISATLRNRILLAEAEVTAQREALARATAALERAIGLLLPNTAAAYEASGSGQRPPSLGSVTA